MDLHDYMYYQQTAYGTETVNGEARARRAVHAEPLAAEFPWDQLADFLATSSEQAGLGEVGHDLSEPQQLIEE